MLQDDLRLPDEVMNDQMVLELEWTLEWTLGLELELELEWVLELELVLI
jgi:hypothetical protein